MTDTAHRFRDDFGCYLGSAYEQKIVAWMTAHGHDGYANEIADASETYILTIGEAGRYWNDCSFTMDRLATINTAIQEAFQAAVDRYEDWATD